jgi:sugar O-acyltransferase (sialic acid O-acetyltransferase NeuD family)
MRDSLVLIGSGGHAKSILFAIPPGKYSEILSLTWGPKSISSSLPIKHLHLRDLSNLMASPHSEYFVAVGDRSLRSEIVKQLSEIDQVLDFATLVSNTATVASDLEMGPGTFIGHGVYVGPGCKIGSHVVLNTRTTLEHDCTLSDFSMISPGAVIGGNVRIGANSFVGIGSTLRDGVSIGDGAVIGAGSLVVKNIQPNSLNYGVPSKAIKEL